VGEGDGVVMAEGEDHREREGMGHIEDPVMEGPEGEGLEGEGGIPEMAEMRMFLEKYLGMMTIDEIKAVTVRVDGTGREEIGI